MSAWAKVKARVDDERAIDKPVAVDVAPSAAAPKDLGPRVKKSRAQRLREREKEAWGMSEEERKKQDNEGARLHWTRLMAQAYDAACPPVLFSKTLHSARERIDERDSNQRTALMIAVLGGSPDDEAALARQQEKAVLLVQAGANMLLYDEDEQTAISLAHSQGLHALCLALVNCFSNADMGVGVVWEGERFPPMVSYYEVRGALSRCPAALAQTTRALVGVYADLEKEQLCACACAAFTLSRQRKDWADGLHNLICWAIEARQRAQQLKLSDSMESDNALSMSVTIELAAAGALTLLSEKSGENAWLYTKAGELLRSARGYEAFSKAVSGECKCFLSQPVVQRFIDREWHGYAFDLLRPESLGRADEEAFLFRMSEGRGWPVTVTLVLIVLPLNLLLLPLVTFCPPLEARVLAALGVRDEGCYILSVPVVKYFASTLFDWVLIFLLAILRHEAPQWQYTCLIAWTGLCVYSEVHELLTAESTVRHSIYNAFMSRIPGSGVRSAYFAATLNWIDLPAATIATVSLAMGLTSSGAAASTTTARAVDGQSDQMHGARMSIDLTIGESDEDVFYATRIARAAALLLLSLRQLKVLLNVPITGPLVMMVIRMLQDLFKWVLIMAIVLLSFILSFDALSSCNDPGGPVALPLALLGGMLTGDALGDVCIFETPAGTTWGIGLSIFYLVLAYVLMFNLLIAVLSKTFDNISDASLINFQLLRAQLLLNWTHQPPAPSPLRLLRLPYELLTMLRAAALHVLRDTRCGRKLLRCSGLCRRIFCRPCSSCCGGHAAPAPLFGLEHGFKLPLGEFRRLEAELHQYILDYSAQREDEVGAEDRWRIQLNKSITSKMAAQERVMKGELDRVGALPLYSCPGPAAPSGIARLRALLLSPLPLALGRLLLLVLVLSHTLKQLCLLLHLSRPSCTSHASVHAAAIPNRGTLRRPVAREADEEARGEAPARRGRDTRPSDLSRDEGKATSAASGAKSTSSRQGCAIHSHSHRTGWRCSADGPRRTRLQQPSGQGSMRQCTGLDSSQKGETGC